MTIREKLQAAGVQPTHIHLALADYLFDGVDKHVTVQEALDALRARRMQPSLASLYNTFNEFCRAGLIRKVTLDGGAACFDTNMAPHYHLYHEDEGRLEDIDIESLKIAGRPQLPHGASVRAIDIVIRVGRN
ncbi:MAG TPA: transcriptional repressor [Parvularculaceae bacterium]|nr:transcriptional repressor [Parvularculaceae bacterium]